MTSGIRVVVVAVLTGSCLFMGHCHSYQGRRGLLSQHIRSLNRDNFQTSGRLQHLCSKNEQYQSVGGGHRRSIENMAQLWTLQHS